MNNIKSYIILNRKSNSLITFFLLITLIVFITLIILSQLKYKKYYQTIGQVTKNENDYQLILYINPYQLNIVKNNEYFIIDDIKYKYKINKIADDYVISGNFNNYMKIILDVSLNNKDKIINNVLKVKFLESDKKLFYYLVDYFLKGEI